MQAMITNSFVSDTLGVNNDLEICTHCEEMVDWFLATTTSYQLIILFCNQSPNKFMASNILFYDNLQHTDLLQRFVICNIRKLIQLLHISYLNMQL